MSSMKRFVSFNDKCFSSQLEKQQKLNELDVVVSLKLHQIQYMINGILPQDLGQTLVFESNGVTRLQLRIKELEHEKHSQKKYMRCVCCFFLLYTLVYGFKRKDNNFVKG
jgi:hypothetical protein